MKVIGITILLECKQRAGIIIGTEYSKAFIEKLRNNKPHQKTEQKDEKYTNINNFLINQQQFNRR